MSQSNGNQINGNGEPISNGQANRLPPNVHNKTDLDRFSEICDNALMARQDFLKSYMDPRKNIDDECGYPVSITREAYKDYYDRFGIASRVVELFPMESWAVTPTIYESEDSADVTAFEDGIDTLAKDMRGRSKYQDEEGSPIWEVLKRADVLSGIGQFGVILIGLDDGLPLYMPAKGVDEQGSQPIDAPVEEDAHDPKSLIKPPEKKFDSGTQNLFLPYRMTVNAEETKGRKLLFLRAFDESLVYVSRYESNPTSPRFGHPVSYNITLNDPSNAQTGIGLPLATYEVHWTRVQHIADTHNQANSSEIFAPPRMRSVFNQLMDIKKVLGGSAEMYWRGAFPGISIESHPQLGGDVTYDAAAMRDQMESYMNGLQRFLALTGMSAKTLSPTVVDPTAQITNQINAICIKLGVPNRIFMGSERGELASSQDAGAWDVRLQERRKNYITPRIIIPFIDRLIAVGVLPEPEGYSIEWPEVGALDKLQKSQVATAETNALVAYVAGNVETILPPADYLTRVLGWDEEEALASLENAVQTAELDVRMTPGAKAEDAAAEAEAQQQQMELDQQDADMKQQHLDKNGELPPEGNPFGGGGPGGQPFGQGGGKAPPFGKGPGNGPGASSGGPGAKQRPQQRPEEKGKGKPFFAANTFCPTGPGGGVDASCSPGKAGAAGAAGAGAANPRVKGEKTLAKEAQKKQKIKDDRAELEAALGPERLRQYRDLNNQRWKINELARQGLASDNAKQRAKDLIAQAGQLRNEALKEAKAAGAAGAKGVGKYAMDVAKEAKAAAMSAAAKLDPKGVAKKVEIDPPGDAAAHAVAAAAHAGRLAELQRQLAADPNKAPFRREEISQPAADIAKLPNSTAEEERYSSSTAKETKDLKPGQHVNKAYKVTLNNGAVGVWKPVEGEAKNMRRGVPNGTGYRREAAAYSVAKAIGMDDLVPITREREIDGKAGSFQQWVSNAKEAGDTPYDRMYDGPKDLARAAAYDVLIGNTDRHGSNWMCKEGHSGEPTGIKLSLIDNGLAFPTRAGAFRSELFRAAAGEGENGKLRVPAEVKDWSWPKIEESLKAHRIEPEAMGLVKIRLEKLQAAANDGRSFRAIADWAFHDGA